MPKYVTFPIRRSVASLFLSISLGGLLAFTHGKTANAQVTEEQLSAATLEQLYAYRQQLEIQEQTYRQAICPNVTQEIAYVSCQFPLELIDLNLRLVNMEIGQREVLRQNGIATP